MAYIEPISMPSAAGVNFGEGDVRHFSEGDAVTVPGISNPTRQLAARDTLLADAVNALITEVNNKEQIIPLPVYRMVVPPSAEEIVANHRIPSGYEARVLNAAISSTPPSSDIELNVLWAEGFGNVAGSAVMTTAAESVGGTTFSPAGEFIIQVKNKGGITLDIVASVMITMRPITDTSGALLPAATVAPAGPPGATGQTGGKGDTGSVGPAGSPGLNFRGLWTQVVYPITYQANDVVTHDFAGTSQRSAYVCTQAHIADGVNIPQPSLMPSPYWDFLAEAGEVGATGGSGAAGSPVTFSNLSIQGTVTTAPTFVAGPTWNTAYSNGNVVAASTIYKVPVQEMTALNPSGTPQGLATLSGAYQLYFYGDLSIRLPDVANSGGAVDYTSNNIRLIAVPHGTQGVVSYGTWAGPEIIPTTYGWDVRVKGPEPIPLQLVVTGSQIVP